MRRTQKRRWTLRGKYSDKTEKSHGNRVDTKEEKTYTKIKEKAKICGYGKERAS